MINKGALSRMLTKISIYALSDDIYNTVDKYTIRYTEESRDSNFKSSLSTYCYLSGTFYFEIEIIALSFCRIGIVNNKYDKYAPVGYDSNGYSYGNDSYIYNNGKRYNYKVNYNIKDIIGVSVRINNSRMEIKENIKEENKAKKIRKGSFIKFYKNSEDLGIAFYNLEGHSFIPIVSMCKGTEVRFNFGPYFAFPEHMTDNL